MHFMRHQYIEACKQQQYCHYLVTECHGTAINPTRPTKAYVSSKPSLSELRCNFAGSLHVSNELDGEWSVKNVKQRTAQYISLMLTLTYRWCCTKQSMRCQNKLVLIIHTQQLTEADFCCFSNYGTARLFTPFSTFPLITCCLNAPVLIRVSSPCLRSPRHRLDPWFSAVIIVIKPLEALVFPPL